MERRGAWVFLWLLFGPALVFARTPRYRDGGASLNLPSDKPVLFVTHGTQDFDAKKTAKQGIDISVRVFKQQGWPVLYLNACGQRNSYLYPPYMADANVTAEICSLGGEHQVTPKSHHVFLSGSYYGMCAYHTFLEVAEKAFEHQKQQDPAKRPMLIAHYILGALYTKENQNLWQYTQESGADINDPKSFSESLLFGLDGGIPRGGAPAKGSYERPRYQIELYYEDQFIKTLQTAESPEAPLLIVRMTTATAIERDPKAIENFFPLK